MDGNVELEQEYNQLFVSEHPFWLQVLRDHCLFFLDSLAAKETHLLQQIHSFYQQFNQLLSQFGQEFSDPQGTTAYFRQLTIQLIHWKQHVLERQMRGQVSIHLPPTFTDHMIREATEYVLVIDRTTQGRPLRGAPLALHSHLLWLPDAVGHAGGIRANLDLQELVEYKRADQWMRRFQDLYAEVLEISTKFRTGVVMFPSFERFTKFTAEQTNLFRHYLLELRELVEESAVLSTLHPLMPDHMAREASYYCLKISTL